MAMSNGQALGLLAERVELVVEALEKEYRGVGEPLRLASDPFAITTDRAMITVP